MASMLLYCALVTAAADPTGLLGSVELLGAAALGTQTVHPVDAGDGAPPSAATNATAESAIGRAEALTARGALLAKRGEPTYDARAALDAFGGALALALSL
jgi:hypothetical protein